MGGISGIMNPAFRSNKPGYHSLIGINSNRRFQEMLSNLASSDGVIMAGVSSGKPGGINRRNVDKIIAGVEQIQCFSECVVEVKGFICRKISGVL
jgi:hypothetical protein